MILFSSATFHHDSCLEGFVSLQHVGNKHILDYKHSEGVLVLRIRIYHLILDTKVHCRHPIQHQEELDLDHGYNGSPSSLQT